MFPNLLSSFQVYSCVSKLERDLKIIPIALKLYFQVMFPSYVSELCFRVMFPSCVAKLCFQVYFERHLIFLKFY